MCEGKKTCENEWSVAKTSCGKWIGAKIPHANNKWIM